MVQDSHSKISKIQICPYFREEQLHKDGDGQNSKLSEVPTSYWSIGIDDRGLQSKINGIHVELCFLGRLYSVL